MLVIVPIQYQRAKEWEEPHPSVTSVHATIPRINYVEQVRDIRKTLEKKPLIKVIDHNGREKSHFVEHEVVVRFAPRPSNQVIQKMLKQVDGKIKRDYGRAMIIKSHSFTTQQLMQHFAEHPDSVFAEPNYLLLPNRKPNDSMYRPYQWNLPMIGMEKSWDISQGSSNVIVAVVDTGVDLDHPEFKGKLVKGYNFIDNSNVPMDDNGHGTHVSGVIAARTNNKTGIAGMSWNSKIMPIKAIGSDGSGSAFDIAQGIYWATDHGADVINLSVGNYTSSAALKEACKYAFDHNVVLVAASGNDASSQPSYPAAYKEVMSVAAVDHRKKQADFSNYGDYVDVAAPGVDIASTYISSDYAALSGTSMACPHVTALASLIRSVQPGMKNTEVIKLIQRTAVDLGPPGKDQAYGYGLINVNQALTQVQKPAAKGEQPAPEPTVIGKQTLGGLWNKFLRQLRLRFE
ncbi:MAG: S8 family peptidase [Clostridia bacterium]